MTTLVTCPCCHGEKVLYVFEQEREGQKFPREPVRIDCCHCQGVGEVDAGEQTADDLLCTCPKPKYTWGPWFGRRSGEKQQVIATLPTLRDAERCPVHRRKDAEIGADNPRKKRITASEETYDQSG